MILPYANPLLILSSLCFLCPSFLSYYKSHYIHSILCFHSSVISTLYWCNTSNKHMLLYDQYAATTASVYWLTYTFITPHKYKHYVSLFFTLSAVSYYTSLQFSVDFRSEYLSIFLGWIFSVWIF
jgi:hypothetical protein